MSRHPRETTTLPLLQTCGLPAGHEPTPPPGFGVDRIVLAKGSRTTAERRAYVDRLCDAYPHAQVLERPETPHNAVDLGVADPVERHRLGVRTLVLGEMGSAVRRSEESGNTCPNYWHFSVYGYCFYGCGYCYLAGTRGVWHSPTVKIYVNLPEILQEVDRVARRLAQPTAFYLGKLQDGLALDPLSGYSQVVVPFFAAHPFARAVILTKSTSVRNLLGLDHGGRTTLSWSLNPPEIAAGVERNVPPVEARLQAMQATAAAGYPVRAVLMPLIPAPGWEETYERFLLDLLTRSPLQRLTMGGICSYANARRLTAGNLGEQDPISPHLAPGGDGDGRRRYPAALRVAMYRHLGRVIRTVRPDLEVGLCLEDREVREVVNQEVGLGNCNCVL